MYYNYDNYNDMKIHMFSKIISPDTIQTLKIIFILGLVLVLPWALQKALEESPAFSPLAVVLWP